MSGDRVKITSSGGLSWNTTVETEDGREVDGVVSVSISIPPEDVVRATIEVLVGSVDVLAHPLLGLDTVRAAAEAHGYRLVKI